jgi:hypothetical protein
MVPQGVPEVPRIEPRPDRPTKYTITLEDPAAGEGYERVKVLVDPEAVTWQERWENEHLGVRPELQPHTMKTLEQPVQNSVFEGALPQTMDYYTKQIQDRSSELYDRAIQAFADTKCD